MIAHNYSQAERSSGFAQRQPGSALHVVVSLAELSVRGKRLSGHGRPRASSLVSLTFHPSIPRLVFS
jgi:hypothetical protein